MYKQKHAGTVRWSAQGNRKTQITVAGQRYRPTSPQLLVSVKDEPKITKLPSTNTTDMTGSSRKFSTASCESTQRSAASVRYLHLSKDGLRSHRSNPGGPKPSASFGNFTFSPTRLAKAVHSQKQLVLLLRAK
jgi:hypothetical protein